MEKQDYQALYRTYRPTKFSDVKGQDFIIKTLENIIISNKISHAYLFSGPRGTGKTTVAKIFATVVNCAHRENIDACDFCISNINKNFDIIEMDAASNNGVDEIRELKENIQNLPTNSKFKIYIIDEVHMLSKSAFNALLKTLEEPPKHIIFILATTDPQKIPLTVLSRLQKFNFSKINLNIITNQLEEILNKEKISFEIKALEKIAKLSDGGLRDALSLLEQAILFSNNDLTLTKVEEIFSLISNGDYVQILNYLNSNSVEKIIEIADSLFEKGIDFASFINNFLIVLRDYIIFSKTKKVNILETLSQQEVENININIKYAFNIITELNNSLKNLYVIENNKTFIEILLLKLLFLNNNSSDENLKNEQKETIKVESISEVAKAIKNLEIDNSVNIINKENTTNNLHKIDNLFLEGKEIKENPINRTSLIKEKTEIKNENLNSNIFKESFLQDEISEEQNEEIENKNTSIFQINNNPSKDNNNKATQEITSIFSQDLNKDLTDTTLLKKSTEVILLDNETIDEKYQETENIINSQDYLTQTKENIYQTNQINLDNKKDEENIQTEKHEIKVYDDLSLENTENIKIETKEKKSAFSLLDDEDEPIPGLKTESIDIGIIEEDILTVDEVINLFGLFKTKANSKDFLQKRKEQLKNLELISLGNKQYEEYINYLLDVKIITATDKFILVSASPENENSIWALNSVKSQINFRELNKLIFEEEIHFFAISKELFDLASQKWKRMQELKTLPDVFNELPEIVYKTQKEIEEEKMISIFGDKFKK
ncbi:DNA polymerase III subunit gamma/tau [Mycoplasma sp. 480]|uniref:DNA polymerase III subunit gamma/tau n=1 Tax=Mycoplasma sp. 480 TaxID=3440155 RepID=UPI003F50D989